MRRGVGMIDRYMMSDITFYQETTFMFPIQIKKLNGNMIYNLTKNKNSNTLFFVCGISREPFCVSGQVQDRELHCF